MGNCAGIVGATFFPPLAHQAPSTSPPQKRVLEHPFRDVRTTYLVGKQLGRGRLGVTYVCTEVDTRKLYACKTIPKRKLLSADDIEDVRTEVSILNCLKGTPNVVQLIDTYEDKLAVHLIMELCEGGELFNRIISKGRYTERAAASLFRTIVQVVQSCHSKGIMHRDLKPENLLFSDMEENSPLKVSEFGVAVFFKEGQIFKDLVGSSYYLAPEVLKQHYGPEADVWSVGVILYMLLSGTPPFYFPESDNEQDIFNAIKKGDINLEKSPWPKISGAAKDVVKKMLAYDPKQRPKPEDILKHSWIQGEAPDEPLDSMVLTNMKQFQAMNKLKKVALKFIADTLSEQEIAKLKVKFEQMDKDNNGIITFEEMKEGLRNLEGVTLPDDKLKELMESADVNRSGGLDYKEFIAATLQVSKLEGEDKLFGAFQYFDKDNSGFITREELQSALQADGIMDKESIDKILEDADTNKDGRIDYQEFAQMMKGKETPVTGPPASDKRTHS